MPKSVFGKWSVRLITIFVLLYGLFQLLVFSGQRGGETFFSNPILAFTGLSMAVSGIAAFFIGIIGIIKDKERSPFVFVATGIGFLILLFCLTEILFPH